MQKIWINLVTKQHVKRKHSLKMNTYSIWFCDSAVLAKINDPFVRYLKYLSSCTKFVVSSVAVFTNTKFVFVCVFGVIPEGHCRWRPVIRVTVITPQVCSWRWGPTVFNHPPFMLLRYGQLWFLFSIQVRGLLEVLHSSAEVFVQSART